MNTLDYISNTNEDKPTFSYSPPVDIFSNIDYHLEQNQRQREEYQRQKKALRDQFDQKKAKSLMVRVLNPQYQKGKDETAKQNYTLQEKSPMEKLLKKKPDFQKEVQHKILKNDNLRAMHYFIDKKIVDVHNQTVPGTSVVQLVKEKSSPRNRYNLTALKAAPSDELTFAEIKSFYFVDLLNQDFLHMDPTNIAILKKNSIKEMLLQLGKRKADDERYKGMMSHPRSTRAERANLEERIKRNSYCMQHCKEKILMLLGEVPYTLQEIEEELKRDKRTAINQELVYWANAELTSEAIINPSSKIDPHSIQLGSNSTNNNPSSNNGINNGDGQYKFSYEEANGDVSGIHENTSNTTIKQGFSPDITDEELKTIMHYDNSTINTQLKMEDITKNKKFNEEKARKAKKFLKLVQADVRALKNRLGVSTLCEYVENFRDYALNDKLDQFMGIVQQSLCSKQRAAEFYDIIKKIVEIENQLEDDEKLRNIKVIEKKYLEENKAIDKENNKMDSSAIAGETHTDTEMIYLFLPFWYIDFTNIEHPKIRLIYNQFNMNNAIAKTLERLTRMKTIEDLLVYYRHNRHSKEYGIFNNEEVRALINVGWSKTDIDEFVRIMVILSKEALLIPRLLFDFAKDELDMETFELENIKGLPLAAISTIITCLLTNKNNLRRIRLKSMEFTVDSTMLFQLLLSSDQKKIIEIDMSDNPVKDDGFDNILKSFKMNPSNQLKVLRFAKALLTTQGGVKITSYIRETNFTHSFLKLQVLSLENNSIGSIGLETICFTLKSNKNLRYLDLSHNRINDGAIASVADMIKSNTTLKVLNLHGNSWSNDSTMKLWNELSLVKDSGLIVFKIGELVSTVDNIWKLIKESLPRLRKLRYCEIVTQAQKNDPDNSIQNEINNLQQPIVIKILQQHPIVHTKKLVDLLSDVIFDEILFEEKQDPSSKTVISIAADHYETQVGDIKTYNKLLPEYLEKHVEDICKGVYKQHTLESVCYVLSELIFHDAELRKGDSFFHRLTQFGQIESVKHILKLGGDPNLRTSLNHPDFPFTNGSYEAVKTLLGYSATVDAKDANENTALHYGASLGRLEICELLLASGCPINVRNKKRMEPIHAAILSDDINVMEYFLQKLNYGASHDTPREIFDHKVYKGLNSLMVAIDNDSKVVVHFILKNNVAINAVDDHGRTAMHLAVDLSKNLIHCRVKNLMLERIDLVSSLLKYKPHLNIKDDAGETIMCYAVKHGLLEVAKVLFDHGARLDVINNRGDTLLHLAARISRVDIIYWLLDMGADSTIQNHLGQLPRDLTSTKFIKDLLPDKKGFQQFNLYSDDHPQFNLPQSNSQSFNNDLGSNPLKTNSNSRFTSKPLYKEVPIPIIKDNNSGLNQNKVPARSRLDSTQIPQNTKIGPEEPATENKPKDIIPQKIDYGEPLKQEEPSRYNNPSTFYQPVGTNNQIDQPFPTKTFQNSSNKSGNIGSSQGNSNLLGIPSNNFGSTSSNHGSLSNNAGSSPGNFGPSPNNLGPSYQTNGRGSYSNPSGNHKQYNEQSSGIPSEGKNSLRDPPSLKLPQLNKESSNNNGVPSLNLDQSFNKKTDVKSNNMKLPEINNKNGRGQVSPMNDPEKLSEEEFESFHTSESDEDEDDEEEKKKNEKTPPPKALKK